MVTFSSQNSEVLFTCFPHSANVLLDQHLNPKLAHPVAHPCPTNKKTKYTVMKTHLFQASAAYLPENFIRVGQLTKQVDIFSCGIVSISFCVSMGLAWSYSRGCWTVAYRPDLKQSLLCLLKSFILLVCSLWVCSMCGVGCSSGVMLRYCRPPLR